MGQRGRDAWVERPHARELAPHRHGGFWKRLLAYLVDWLILVLIAIVVVMLGVVLMVAGGVSELWAWAFGHLVGLLVGWVYYAFLESSDWQATPGKRMLGMQVVDMQSGRIGLWRATGRHFGKIVSTLVLLAGFVMIGFAREKQELHDIMAGCVVVNRPPPADKLHLD